MVSRRSGITTARPFTEGLADAARRPTSPALIGCIGGSRGAGSRRRACRQQVSALPKSFSQRRSDRVQQASRSVRPAPCRVSDRTVVRRARPQRLYSSRSDRELNRGARGGRRLPRQPEASCRPRRPRPPRSQRGRSLPLTITLIERIANQLQAIMPAPAPINASAVWPRGVPHPPGAPARPGLSPAFAG